MKGLRCTVDCARVAHNIEKYRRPVILMAKANCYGLGLTVARRVQPHVAGYGVAYAEEGAALRTFTSKPILVCSPMWSVEDVVRYDLTPCVQSVEDVQELAEVRVPVGVHLKLNTGMNRFGISTVRELRRVLQVVERNPYIRVVGAYTHYASAQDYRAQNERLLPMLRMLPKDINVHTQATSTADFAGYDTLRIGMGAYRDSVRLDSDVVAVRRLWEGERAGYDGIYTAQKSAWIATVQGGYADGVAKALRGHLVCIGQHLYPIVAVCMDVCLVAVDRPVAEGTSVNLLGDTPEPNLSLYEMYTGLGHRWEYTYIGEA